MFFESLQKYGKCIRQVITIVEKVINLISYTFNSVENSFNILQCTFVWVHWSVFIRVYQPGFWSNCVQRSMSRWGIGSNSCLFFFVYL